MGKLKALIEQNRDKILQFIRFCIVGTVAAGIHYGLYFLLMDVVGWNYNAAYASGYIISFICNYIASCYFTFHSRPSWGHLLGFAGSHGVNFLLHMGLINLFTWLAVNKYIAPILTMGVAMLVQYAILNFVFKDRGDRLE